MSSTVIGSVWSDSGARFDPALAGDYAGDPTLSANLVLWLDGKDASQISGSGTASFQWKDKSKNLNHFNVRPSYSGPTYVAATNSALPYVQFTSSTSLVSSLAWTLNTGGTALTASNQRWLFAVISLPAAAAPPNSRFMMWFGANLAANRAFGFDIINSTSASTSFFPYTYGNGDVTAIFNNYAANSVGIATGGYIPDGANKTTGSPGSVYGAWSIAATMGNTMQTATAISLATDTTGSAGSGLTLTDFSKIYIGGRRNDNQASGSFRVYEILLYSFSDNVPVYNGVSPFNYFRPKVQAYLAQKWGIINRCSGDTCGNFVR